MPRYDYVLLDADNTLFDFDLAEHKALGLTLASHGIPFTPEAEQTYIDINTALWSKFDRGEISQGELVVERFSAFLRAVGRAGDPAELNRYYLSRLYQLIETDQCCRRIANRKDYFFSQCCSTFHTDSCTGTASVFRFLCHICIRHKAECLAAILCQFFLVDP